MGVDRFLRLAERKWRAMPRCLYTVEDTFVIEGRGLVSVPGIVPREQERSRIGDRVEIRRPDGSRLGWAIGGTGLIHCTPPKPTNEVLILLREPGKEDVPIGSEVWSVGG